ncbi:MAG: hypothetical protein HY316_00620 [Acidobacteria bacterium]|nr:hypothetical protein [Acidobacteriota bacterium]
MKHHLSFAALAAICVFAASLVAQDAPKGWKLRIDRSTSASDPDGTGDANLVTKGSGFYASSPKAAVYWNPANAASGNFSLKGTFTLMGVAAHNEYYGLIFGGSDLDGAGQSYLYFMVAQDGTWLIKRREGNGTKEVSAKTASDAVKRPDSSGRSTNALEVRVMAGKIDFLVNGTVVSSLPKTGPAANTDGIYGFHVNHHLEVQVDAFALSTL